MFDVKFNMQLSLTDMKLSMIYISFVFIPKRQMTMLRTVGHLASTREIQLSRIRLLCLAVVYYNLLKSVEVTIYTMDAPLDNLQNVLPFNLQDLQ